jgi:O-antigen/teichoic acid export membrane protein
MVFTTAERYSNLVVNFAMIAIVSRLLTPAEIGVSAIGATIWALVETLRDVPSSYLVQQHDLTEKDVRTSFTVMLLISLVLAGALIIIAPWIATKYQDANLGPYLRVLALAFLPSVIERPIMALFRRDLSFGRYALVNFTGIFVNATTTVVLAALGFSFMSFACGMLAGTTATAVLAVYLRPQFGIFRPHLGYWRRAVRFGAYTSVQALLGQLVDLLPYLVLSRFFKFDAVGYHSRALTVTQSPNKLLLSGLAPVVFPALAAEARAGRDLKAPFLMAVSYISAVVWPAFLLMALIAHPAVEVLVGPQWFTIVPLVQILSVAMLATFANMLVYPTLMAVGALRDMLMSTLVIMPFTASFNAFAASFGLMPLALSCLITYPLQNFVALSYVRRHVDFTWRELFTATAKSALVAACAGAIPAATVLMQGSFALSIPVGALLGGLAVVGWLGGLWLTQHPLREELVLVLRAIHKRLRRRADAPLSAEIL